MSTIPTYPTPPHADTTSAGLRPGLVSRVCPTPVFYWRVVRIVLASARLARKGVYTDFDWYEASRRVRVALEMTGARISITGTGHLAAQTGPCVIIGNHMSTAETFILPSILRPFQPVTFVVKQSLVEYPVFKHVMRSRNPIVVGRVNAREDLKAVLEGGRERLASGISIIIFPQRTRTVQFDREAFNTIGVKLAKRAGVPVIPLALQTNAWGNGKLLKDYGPIRPELPVRFAFGAPLPAGGNDHAVHDAVVAFIEERLRQWGLPVTAP